MTGGSGVSLDVIVTGDRSPVMQLAANIDSAETTSIAFNRFFAAGRLVISAVYFLM